MKKLIKGLHKFQTQVFPIQKDFFQDLVKGQNPEALFITCSDSRINPHLMLSAEPGELFILRNTGNIIPPYGNSTSEEATIEFAVGQLQVKNIIICGHSHCGAIQAGLQLDSVKYPPSLTAWIESNIGPSVDLVRRNYQHLEQPSFFNVLIQEHVLRQVEHLKTHPIIKQAIEHHHLLIHAWVYQFEKGEILAFDPEEGQFNVITQKSPTMTI